jgi:hypothetical protein
VQGGAQRARGIRREFDGEVHAANLGVGAAERTQFHGVVVPLGRRAMAGGAWAPRRRAAVRAGWSAPPAGPAVARSRVRAVGPMMRR